LRFPWSLSRPLLYLTLRDAASIHAAGVSAYLLLKIDLLILNAYVPASAVGCYALAVMLGEILFLLPYAAQAVLYSRVATQPSEELVTQMAARAARHTFYLAALGGGAFFTLAPWLVALLGGAEFQPAVGPLRILLPGIVFHSVS